eukprot:TRINITY_DN17701_c1_g2_i2.p1 TRINITY_DN17701_c1_g2~~TRINITY_DN17701_c1_g2_i2.p1  ORF type:complete len:534 (+),score=110.06 TRINITY_DN17701_c1_g2_i2:97-1698(+)
MSDCSCLIFLLISSLALGSPAQSSGSQGSSLNENFSISSTSFASLLSTSLKQTAVQLESNPENLDAILENIAQATIGAIEKIATQVKQNTGKVDSEIVADEIGGAVNTSLTPLISVKNFENLDVENVSQQVEDAVKKVLDGVGKGSSVEKITEDLGNALIEAIGEALSKVSGVSFSFKVEISEGSSTEDVPPSPSPPQLSPAASNFLRLLQAGDVDGVVKAMLKQIQQTGDLNTIYEFFTVVAGNEAYYSSMAEVFTIFFGDANSPIQQLSDILGPVYERNSNITVILSEAVLLATSKNQVEGLVPLISVAFTGQGPLNDVMLKSIEGAISSGGCNPFLGNVLSRSKEIADNANAFQSSIVSSAKASSCLAEGLKNQFSFSIVDKLSEGDIDGAFKATKSTQVTTIVTSFILSIQSGYEIEVSEFLVKFFEDDNITPRKLTVMIATFLIQDPVNAPQILINSMLRTQNQQNLVATFIYAFTKANSKEFVTLVKASIQNKSCALTNIIGGVLADSDEKQVEEITEILVEGGAPM